MAARFSPCELQLVERAENALFEIDRQLERHHPRVARRPLLHDVVDESSTLRLLRDLRPDVVFHTAAHKHVPLMEDHAAHALNNNFFGTKSIADAAAGAGCGRFVMVSSDKAVNPTSVMGATKRLAELYIHGLHSEVRRAAGPGGATRFSMVRFGNVLGSACSVLTIWSAQLAEGGPITVTDPRMTRYFMTIAEAAGLVIQAAAIDRPGEAPAAVHVLDMGEPIPILDLVRRFLRAHGFEPRVSEDAEAHDGPARRAGLPGSEGPARRAGLPGIDVVCTGIRPGEKIHEELAYAAENLLPTPYPGISAWAREEAPPATGPLVADLRRVRHSTDRGEVLAAIRRHVPEMTRG
ncbi:MAG: polysaccharide biosynthesis protein [Phycisphaerales bacterium]